MADLNENLVEGRDGLKEEKKEHVQPKTDNTLQAIQEVEYTPASQNEVVKGEGTKEKEYQEATGGLKEVGYSTTPTMRERTSDLTSHLGQMAGQAETSVKGYMAQKQAERKAKQEARPPQAVKYVVGQGGMHPSNPEPAAMRPLAFSMAPKNREFGSDYKNPMSGGSPNTPRFGMGSMGFNVPGSKINAPAFGFGMGNIPSFHSQGKKKKGLVPSSGSFNFGGSFGSSFGQSKGKKGKQSTPFSPPGLGVNSKFLSQFSFMNKTKPKRKR